MASEIVSRGNGLSELTATILLIAITLIACVVLYEYLISGQSASTQNATSAASSFVASAGGNPATGFYSS